MKFAIATLFAAAAFSTFSTYAQDTIQIATEGAYKPWSFVNDSGKLDGFEIDLTNALCARIKAECKVSARHSNQASLMRS